MWPEIVTIVTLTGRRNRVDVHILPTNAEMYLNHSIRSPQISAELVGV